MRVAILGLGPSLKDYKESSNYDIVIGVNDIEKHHTVDYLLVTDPPKNFTEERLQTIKNSKPRKGFITTSYTEADYKEFNPIIIKAPFKSLYQEYNRIDNAWVFPVSTTSTFTSIVYAFKYLHATYIKVYGMDLTNHKHIKRDKTVMIDKYQRQVNAGKWLLNEFKRLNTNGVDITFEWTEGSFFDRHFKEGTT